MKVNWLFETKRIAGRELLSEDVTDKYLIGLNDKEVVRFTDHSSKRWSRSDLEKYVEENRNNPHSLLIGLFTKESLIHFGNLRLSNLGSPHKRVDLGIMLFDKSYWGKGLATESLLAASEYAFSRLRCHRICADYHENNHASARAFEKALFKVEGVFRDHFFIGEQFVDSVRVARIDRTD